MSDQRRALTVLAVNTLAFTVCFAVWTMNGVLVTYLVDRGVYDWNEAQMGWLIGLPVLTGSLSRLPLGILTDRFGGRIVYATLLFLAAVPTYLLGSCDTYAQFAWASLGFGLAGGSFAVGIAYTSVWFSRQRQGTALGIFGAGNAGSALTSMGAPLLLAMLTQQHTDLEAWRQLPRLYAAALVVMGIAFVLFTHDKRAETGHVLTLRERLAPLRHVRTWRFGTYYLLVFGAYVGLSQWLIPYYVNVYGMTVAMAGMMAAVFSLPGGVIRALGGWMSDHWGARRVMYWVLGGCLVCCALLIVPRMDIQSPGSGVMAARAGMVHAVSDSQIVVDDRIYPLRVRPADWNPQESGDMAVLPTTAFWQEPAVRMGDRVEKRQLLARGVTHVYFQANMWIFTALVFAVGFLMGIGKAAVYRHIPDYFPNEVGVVGGIVGVIGGLGGFVFPILFGYLLRATGIWTTSWMVLTVFSAICLVWMHIVVQRMQRRQQPELMRRMDHDTASAAPVPQRG
jgi:NNP family nitrate/nitrite transporter-like MFS transporter